MNSLLIGGLLFLATLPDADRYLDARKHEAAGKYSDALAVYESLGSEDTPLAPYARVGATRCRGLSGDFDGAIAGYEALLRSESDGPWIRMIESELALRYYEHARYADAARTITNLLDLPVAPRWLESYSWTLGECLMKSPETQSAAGDLFESLYDAARTRQRRLDAASFLVQSPELRHKLDAITAMLSANEVRDAGLAFFSVFPALADAGPEYQAQMLYIEARLQLAADPEKGHQSLRSVAEAHPDTAWGRQSLYQLARSLYALEKKDEAAKVMAQLKAGSAGFAESGDALWWYAERLRDDDTIDRACEEYLQLAALCPNHDRADDALFAAGQLMSTAKKPERAAEAYTSLGSKYPGSPFAAAAWYEAGRIHEESGDSEKAGASYGLAAGASVGDFYAHRAAERLDELESKRDGAAPNLVVDGLRSFVRPVKLDGVTPSIAVQEWRDLPWAERLAFFGDHGLPEADWEALHAVQHIKHADEAGHVYQALAEIGMGSTAVQFMDVHGWGWEKGRPTIDRLRVMYPRAYWKHVRDAAQETRVDPYLILAVGRQESIFQARVVSSAGATGVMQLMPATARWLAKIEPAVDPALADNLTVPENSLRLGAHFLTRLISRNDSNLVFALASYNAGPGNVSKWKKSFSTDDMEQFIDDIPFEETRGFVKKVLGNYAAYHSLYPEPDRFAER